MTPQSSLLGRVASSSATWRLGVETDGHAEVAVTNEKRVTNMTRATCRRVVDFNSAFCHTACPLVCSVSRA